MPGLRPSLREANQCIMFMSQKRVLKSCNLYFRMPELAEGLGVHPGIILWWQESIFSASLMFMV